VYRGCLDPACALPVVVGRHLIFTSSDAIILLITLITFVPYVDTANKIPAAQIAMDLQTYLAEIHTDPTIIRLLCRGIHRWIMHNENASEPLATDDEDGSKAMEAQSEIGWHLAMRGWMSKQWAKMQETWIKRSKSDQNREQSGNTWSAKVSKWLIRKSREFWTERNHQRQESSSPDDQGTSRAEKEVNVRMERLYAREMNIAQRDREIFQVPIVTRMRMSLRQKRAWLDRVTPHVNEAERRFRERLARGQMDLLEMWDKQLESSTRDTPEAEETHAETTAAGIQRDRIDDDSSVSENRQNDERQRNSVGRNSENSEQTAAITERQRSNVEKRAEKRTEGQQSKRTINTAAWGSLKPHTTKKKSEQDKRKKKKTKANKTQARAANQNVPTEAREIATDTVRRGRLPKFKFSDERKTVESNSNPDDETTTHRSGSPSRHEM
jgi:hypothetical protein